MARPRVVHCKREEYDVYIGRPGTWGNPFSIGPDGTRGEVIQKFRDMILGDEFNIDRVRRELKDKTLGCWCAPQPCHGDVLLEIANEQE